MSHTQKKKALQRYLQDLLSVYIKWLIKNS